MKSQKVSETCELSERTGEGRLGGNEYKPASGIVNQSPRAGRMIKLVTTLPSAPAGRKGSIEQ